MLNLIGEVNKARHMPQDEFVVATKTTSGQVHVFDVTKHPSMPAKDQPSQPQVRCLGHTAEGYAIDWNPINKGQIVSGADDGSICRWDLGSLSRDSAATAEAIVSIPNAHEGATEDVQWHTQHNYLFASCGDDGMVRVWDTRAADPTVASQVFKAHDMEANALSFAPTQEFTIVTGSADKTLKLWDMRNTKRELHVLEGHTDEVLNIRWAPFSEAVLTSGGADRRVMVWDLSRIGQEQTEEDKEDGPPELLFIHGGHTSKINDMSWNMQDPWVMASVAEDNILQVWKMAENILVDDDDVIGSGGASKNVKDMDVDGVRPSSPTDKDLE
jgi:histone-binding protein RBBP4